MAFTVVTFGQSYLADSPAPHARWVENPGDAMEFTSAGAADAFAAARGVSFAYAKTSTFVGGKNPSKRELD